MKEIMDLPAGDAGTFFTPQLGNNQLLHLKIFWIDLLGQNRNKMCKVHFVDNMNYSSHIAPTVIGKSIVLFTDCDHSRGNFM